MPGAQKYWAPGGPAAQDSGVCLGGGGGLGGLGFRGFRVQGFGFRI